MPQIDIVDKLFNSSDQEYKAAVKPYFRTRLKSIELMYKSYLVGVARPIKIIFGNADVYLISIATQYYRYEKRR